MLRELCHIDTLVVATKLVTSFHVTVDLSSPYEDGVRFSISLVVQIPLKPHEAQNSRNALAKARRAPAFHIPPAEVPSSGV